MARDGAETFTFSGTDRGDVQEVRETDARFEVSPGAGAYRINTGLNADPMIAPNRYLTHRTGVML